MGQRSQIYSAFTHRGLDKYPQEFLSRPSDKRTNQKTENATARLDFDSCSEEGDVSELTTMADSINVCRGSETITPT